MRTRICIILIMLVLLAGISGNAEANISYEHGNDFEYAVSGKRVWIVSGRLVTIMDNRLERVISSFDIPHGAEHISAHADRVFIHYYDGSGQYIAIYDTEGELTEKWSLDNELNIIDMDSTEDHIVLLVSGGSGPDEAYQAAGEVYTIALDSGIMSPIAGNGLYSAIAVNAEHAAVYSMRDGMIYVFRLATGELTDTYYVNEASWIELTADGELFILVINKPAGTGTVYYAESGSSKLHIVYEAADTLSELLDGAGYLYFKDGRNMLRAVPAELPQSGGNVLRFGCFIGVPEYYQNITEAFELTEEDIPGITYEFIIYDNEEVLLTDAMSGVSGIDIYFIPDFALLNAANLYRAGAICDLRDIPAVMDNYGQLIDITEIMSCDGAVVAVPQTMIPTAIEVNLPLFEEYGLSVPQFDWTWQDFFELAAQVEQLREEGHDVFLVHDAYEPIPVHQYVVTGLYDGRLDLDTEEFRYVMENWKYYIDCGVIMPAYEAGSVFSIPENALLYAGEVGHVNFTAKTNSGEAAYVLLPGYGTAGNTLVSREMVCMSSRAQNPEAAAVFMANCIDISIYSDELFYENEGNLLADFSVLETVRGESRYPMSYPTTENSLIWRELMESGIYDWHNMPFEIFFDWYIEYINGEISIDEYIFKSQERIDMVLGE